MIDKEFKHHLQIIYGCYALQIVVGGTFSNLAVNGADKVDVTCLCEFGV